jgi:hypothetical protein
MLNTARFIPENTPDWDMQMPIPSQMGRSFIKVIDHSFALKPDQGQAAIVDLVAGRYSMT